MGKNVAVVLAAGRGKRMQSSVHKQYLMMGGRPVLFYCLKAMEDSFMDEVVLVVGEGEEGYCRKEVVEKYGFQKVSRIVQGGRERYHSVWNGISAIQECSYLYIHDGARPFLDQATLERARQAVEKFDACVVGMPVKDTIKIAGDDGFSKETPRRDTVWTIQTPQVFSFELVKKAYGRLLKEEGRLRQNGTLITDDAMVVEYFTDTAVKLIEGNYRNIKITTPEDLQIAEAFLGQI